MAITPRSVLNGKDLHVKTGFGRVPCALISERDGDVDLQMNDTSYDLYSPRGEALSARVTTHVKWEDVWDSGDGREGLDVVCWDGKPVAIVRESGFDSFTYMVQVIDLAAVDDMVAAARSLRKNTVQDMVQVDMDDDIANALGLTPPTSPSVG